MADTKISALTERTTIADTDNVPGLRSGDTKGSRWTGATIKNILGIGAINVKDPSYGATGDGVTDDTVAINLAIAALSAGGKLHFPPGIYVVTSEIDLTGLAHCVIEGCGPYSTTKIIGEMAASDERSVISCIGADYITFRDIEITSILANAPKTVFTSGRDANGNGSGINWFGGAIRGYATQSLVYMVSTDTCRFYGTTHELYGGGAKYLLTISRNDDLSITGYTLGTALACAWHGCDFMSSATDADAAVLNIFGSTSCGDLAWRDCYVSGANGYGIRIYATDGGANNYTFDNPRIESNTGLDYGFYLDASAAYAIGRLNINHPTLAGSISSGFMYATDNVTISQADWNFVRSNISTSSIYNIQYSKVFDHHGDVTVRGTGTNNLVFVSQSVYTWTWGAGSTGNVTIEKGKLKIGDWNQSAIAGHNTTTTTWNPGSLADGASASINVAVNAALGDTIAVGFPTLVGAVANKGHWQISGRVTTTNEVTVTITNHTGGTVDLDSATLRVDVWKH